MTLKNECPRNLTSVTSELTEFSYKTMLGVGSFSSHSFGRSTQWLYLKSRPCYLAMTKLWLALHK